jgi:hypothetical protein
MRAYRRLRCFSLQGCRLIVHLYGFRDGSFHEEATEADCEVAGESLYDGNPSRRRHSARFTSVVNDIELASYADSRLTETLGASHTICVSSRDESAGHD